MKKEDLVRNIYITTNVSCNLSCIYCYEDKTSKLTFDIENAKEQLTKQLSIKTPKGTIVNLHGGEPFMVFPKIKELCEWLWSQNFPEQFTMFATSNGTLIHGEIKEWLLENKSKFIVGLSLDGNKKMHDTNRSNSFDLIDLDFIINTWPKQGIKMTISPLTIDQLSEGIIFLHSKGVKNISANLAYMVDWSDSKYIKIYQRELKKLADFYKKNQELIKASIFNVGFALLAKDDDDKSNPIRKWCGCGTEIQAKDINGKLYPCHLFFESVCGKEKSEKAQYINFSDPNEYTKGECVECPALAICPTCYGSNYIERGDIGKRDMTICKLEKVRFLEVAKFEYDRIVNDANTNDLSDDEKTKRYLTLEGIERILPFLEELENSVKQL